MVASTLRGISDLRAEQALRTSFDLWPHWKTAFSLGMALHRQGRPVEALEYLGAVCRTNRRLLHMVPDEDLRDSIKDFNRARSMPPYSDSAPPDPAPPEDVE